MLLVDQSDWEDSALPKTLSAQAQLPENISAASPEIDSLGTCLCCWLQSFLDCTALKHMDCYHTSRYMVSRSERLAKYNQLLRIEEELGSEATYAGDSWRHIAW